jgi:hypothetical protein
MILYVMKKETFVHHQSFAAPFYHFLVIEVCAFAQLSKMMKRNLEGPI